MCNCLDQGGKNGSWSLAFWTKHQDWLPLASLPILLCTVGYIKLKSTLSAKSLRMTSDLIIICKFFIQIWIKVGDGGSGLDTVIFSWYSSKSIAGQFPDLWIPAKTNRKWPFSNCLGFWWWQLTEYMEDLLYTRVMVTNPEPTPSAFQLLYNCVFPYF